LINGTASGSLVFIMSDKKSVRIGIIGLGNMGTSHASAIERGDVPGLELTAVADAAQERLSKWKSQKQFTNASDLIQSDCVDAVLIATPHYSHTTLGIEALERGLHVLVEKPISVHKADCERLIAAWKNPKQVFAAMFNQRTDPSYTKLKELIESGELGEVRRFSWTVTDWFRTERYYRNGDWRATWAGEGGGVLLNQCPHNLDLLQWLFGMPDTITAHCQFGRFHNIEVEDDVTAYLKYKDGKNGVFITTTGEAPGTNRLEVAAERGKVVIEKQKLTFTRNEVPTGEFSRSTDKAFGRPPVWNIDIPVDGRGEQHVGIMKNFVAAILRDEPLIAPAPEGIHSVELANAMLYSTFTEKPVTLPLNAADYAAILKKKIETSTHVKESVAQAEVVDTSGSF
jgi:predicted dehydrogenase